MEEEEKEVLWARNPPSGRIREPPSMEPPSMEPPSIEPPSMEPPSMEPPIIESIKEPPKGPAAPPAGPNGDSKPPKRFCPLPKI